MAALLLAVDVGSTVARAGLFDDSGRMLSSASFEFEVLRPREGHAVYRMDVIWNAVTAAIRDCLAVIPGSGMLVVGMAFDAGASLVLAHDGAPPLEGAADVLGWMDHRAEAEAAEITALGDLWLDHMGGALSPENHLPKLLWLQRNTPAAWARVTGLRDLADELARRATGVQAQSICTRAAKWPYLPHDETGWRHDLLDRLGMGTLWTMGALPDDPLPVGAVHGILLPAIAEFLGLPPGIPVAAGLIDGAAGMLGVVGRAIAGRTESTLALIGGTSTSFMALTAHERLIPGVWGPFRGVVLPGLWMHEAGQSCTGAALDAVLEHHPGGPHLATAELHRDTAAEILDVLEREGSAFAARRHMVPDWLGNRSPMNDGRKRALLAGQGEELGGRAFLEAYYATARALALQARQILEHLNSFGYAIKRVALSGAHSRNRLLERLYRDILGPDLVVSHDADTVLLGTAMVAAVAAGVHPSLLVAVDLMAPSQTRFAPDRKWRRAHDLAYGIYLEMYSFRNDLDRRAADLEAIIP